MKWPFVVAIALFSLMCSSAEIKSSEEILADKVLTASRSNDSTQLSEKDYEQITVYLSEGYAYWIGLYPVLTRSPFLGQTSFQEGLNIAMAYALPANPAKVLMFLNEENVNAICGVPFIEPARDEVLLYVAKSTAALSKLNSGGDWKERCMTVLNAAVTHLNNTMQPE
ncbi:hypothetical protein [Pantoea anthophila]|uniref:hypothetical protein n=1 Tax=Pantoea anthophila TaxID=470931 RepID=UPI0027844891|nr:hypothetical protein [Pantoea anthophila]MDQ1212469.1 sulfur relay (sulfurtransferase) DsrF/TusC family protein [Pantoea anthophila]